MQTITVVKKTALITGASRGIGRVIALRLADDEFRIVINYNQSKKEALELEAILKQKNRECFLVKADISKESEVRQMVGLIRQKYGHIDVLINNAGIITTQPLGMLNMKSYDRIINTNLRGSILVTKYALPLLKKSSKAKIIFTLSSSAFVGSSAQFAYAVSKAGLVGAVRALALELAPLGILVNGVAPGYVNTQMASSVKGAMKKGIKKIPLGRIAEPEEVAELIAYLSSPSNTYITGQCIHINGARFMQ